MSVDRSTVSAAGRSSSRPVELVVRDALAAAIRRGDGALLAVFTKKPEDPAMEHNESFSVGMELDIPGTWVEYFGGWRRA